MITTSTPLQTTSGLFTVSYHVLDDDYCVSLYMNTKPDEVPLVRIHSSCLFGEGFGAIDCDCRSQLRGAIELIASVGHGAVVYKHDEGRGMGIENKIRAMSLQSAENITTAQAYDKLGFPRDNRSYRTELEALRDLGLTSIKLISANPRKLKALKQAGINVVEECHIAYDLNPIALKYVISKQDELAHFPIYKDLQK